MGKGKEETKQEMPAFQKQYLTGSVLPFAKQISKTPFEAYTGPMAPEMSGYTTQAADIYGNMAGADTTQQLIDTTQALYNPYQQDVIDTSLAQMGRQQQQALTGLEGQLAGSGAFGSRGEVARGEFAVGNGTDLRLTHSFFLLVYDLQHDVLSRSSSFSHLHCLPMP